MKNLTKLVLFFFLTLSLSVFEANGQDLSSLHEVAHYTLQETAADRLGNLEDIELTNAPFDGDEGVYSFGGYLFDVIDEDSSRVRVDRVESLLDSAFALRVEFKLDTLEERNRPLLIIGDSWRYLGLVKRPDHTLDAMHNTRFYDTNAAALVANQWYEITIVYTQEDSMASYYLDGALVYSHQGALERPETDLGVSNTHSGQGNAFRGHWRNLRIYGSDMITASERIADLPEVRVFPNPASEWVQISIASSDQYDLEYALLNSAGSVVKTFPGSEHILSLADLAVGVYWLRITENGRFLHMERLIIE